MIKTPLEVVIQARNLAWLGQPFAPYAREQNIPYPTLWQAVRGVSFAWLLNPPPVPLGYKPGPNPTIPTVEEKPRCKRCGILSKSELCVHCVEETQGSLTAKAQMS